jgi:hypothetical protein
MNVTLHTDVGGAYEVTLYKAPAFSSMNNTVVMSSSSTAGLEISFVNATSGMDRDKVVTSWDDAELRVSGPTECSASFTVSMRDNCPSVYNPDQKDSDNDSIGDACDKQTCNNSVCEAGENSTNCCNDCGCLPGQTCTNNVCEGKQYKCLVNSDCKDSNKCTRDLCFHPNTTYAHCGYEEITYCSKDNADDCCPDGCNANTDIDCGPTCGNSICEDFFGKENYGSCHYDCPLAD